TPLGASPFFLLAALLGRVVMVVIMIMPVVMMAVVMIVVVVVMVMVVIGVGIGVKFLGRHLGVRYLGEFEHVVDGFILEDRRPELSKELGVVAVIIVDLAFLARELPDALEQRPAHFLVGHGDLVARAALREDQPKPDAAGSDVVIFGFRLLLGGAFVLEAPF